MAGYDPWDINSLSNIDNSENNMTNNWGMTPYKNAASLRDSTPAQDTSGYNGEASSTATNAITSAIGTGAQIASSAIAANAQNKEIEKAAAQDKQLADLSLNDKMRQNRIDLSMKRKEQEIEKQRMDLQRKTQQNDYRIRGFLNNIQQGMAEYNQAREAAMRLKAMSASNPKMRELLARSFGG